MGDSSTTSAISVAKDYWIRMLYGSSNNFSVTRVKFAYCHSSHSFKGLSKFSVCFNVIVRVRHLTRSPWASYQMAAMHVPWCMQRSGKMLPAFPVVAQPAILRIWQETHGPVAHCSRAVPAWRDMLLAKVRCWTLCLVTGFLLFILTPENYLPTEYPMKCASI